jgi:acyl transferase domain-containing protein/acyl carrier protein
MSGETGREIAVIGMAGRFPGARDLKQLWRNLRDGVEGLTFFSDEELLAAGVPAERLRDPRYVKAASLLAGVDRFDAPFFGYSAREAEILDPQQRLFLEHSWAALEDAGYSPEAYDGLIGVYAGVAWNTYLLSNLRSHPELFDGGGGFQVFITNDKDFMPTRVSYKLNLKGPSLTVQTSCSTSLVAIHLACLSLLSYECDMALGGGVTVKVPQVEGYWALDGGLASPDGHCRTFDADAAGTIFGSGVGVVVLKRLSEALADGDSIHAVIKGSAINNDGSLKVSYTAPSVEGQAEVVAAAQAVAGVEPETIRYIEAHGTGTSLGDPIEVAALTKVFRESTGRTGFCALGSVKTNVGHLDAAAGVAGFLKTVLALENREIPPSLNFTRPNPAIDFAASPFYVNAALAPWEAPEGGIPRRAGVSSFGVGGTNAHVILEEAPEAAPPAASRPWQLLTLSARSPEALEEATRNLFAWLGEADPAALPDAAYTLKVGRSVFRHRRALVCRDRDDALAALETLDPARVLTAEDLEDPRDRPLVFLFPGEGVHANLGRGLYETEPVFRAEIDHCAERLRPLLNLDLRRALYPAAGEEEAAAHQLARPALAEPALFAVEYALARLLMSWGVRPQAMLGDGVGGLTAACLAGVMPLDDALASAVNPANPAPLALRAPEIPLLSSAELHRDPRRLLLEVGPGNATGQAVLTALGRLWLAGLRLDWSGFYSQETRRRVPLPTYPFERQRYWIEAAPAMAPENRTDRSDPTDPSDRSALRKTPDLADWFWLPAWKPALPPVSSPLGGGGLEQGGGQEGGGSPGANAAPRHRWLVLAEPGGASAELAARLAAGGEVITVEPEELRPGLWEALLADLRSQDRLPDAVVHAWGLTGDGPPVDDAAGFEAAQEHGFYALLELVQAIAKHPGGTPRELVVVASGLAAVSPEEAVRPERATVLGLLRVLPQEVPGLSCRAVDAVVPAGGRRRERALDALAAEVAAGPGAPLVAWRGDRRSLPDFTPVRLEAPEEAAGAAGITPAPLRWGGVYLLTGGLENNGFGFARYLAGAARGRLVLAEETPLPPEREQRLRALRELGAEVAVETGGLAAAVALAESRFGALHGVVHAAGTMGERTFCLVRELDREACGWHFQPKAHALFDLERALAGRELDFCVLLSSLATVLGGVAYSAYTAANLFLEAFVREHNRKGEQPWVSLGWDVWQTEGDQEQITAVRDDLAALAMDPREGEEAFRRAVAARGVDLVLVSTADLPLRIERAGRRIGEIQMRAGAMAAETAPARHPRPSLATPYAAPEGDLESRIAAVWQRTLGFERIGVHDNFFELGGDSFVAVQVVSRLQDELGIQLAVARLYQGLTVRSLAALLAQDEAAASGGHAALLEERRESMGRRREFLERRRASKRGDTV